MMCFRMPLNILFILLSVIQQPVICLAQETQQLVVTVGEDITIPCTSSIAYPSWTGPELFNGYTMRYNNGGNKNFANPNIPAKKKARLGWGSDSSSLVIKNVTVIDGGLYQCSTIAKINLFVRVPPRTAVITNVEVSTDNNLIIRATESQVTNLICDTSGGYPEPLVEWYRGNTGTKPLISTSIVTAGTQSYNVSEKYRFTPQRQDDGTRYICQSSFKTDPRHISAVSIELVLNLKPNLPIALQTSAISAGNIAEVKCNTNGSRPAANMSWSYRGEILAGVVTATPDATSKTYTVVSLFKRRVTAEDNGQTVQCVVTHVSLVEPPQLTASVVLNVHYPPVVTVTATNTTVEAKHAVLICNATGSPNTDYKYGKWVHTWSGVTTVLSEKHGSERLVLTNLTYEHSGVYTCSASNGVKVFGSNKEFIEGSVQLSVKSFPVITNPTVNSVNVSAAVNATAKVTVDYFSNRDESDVKCFKIVREKRQEGNVCSFDGKKVIVNLPVLGHIIKTDGVRATISFGINLKNDFGFYDIIFSNEIGSASLKLQIVPIEPPAVPYDLKTVHIKSASVRISWKQRFDSEFPQTFVIQMSADNIIWFNATTVDVDTGEHEGNFSTGLENLQESSIYFVRMYAYNKGGKSSFTKSFNFTTLTKDKDTTASIDDKSTLIVGVVLGLVIVALALYAVYVTILLKRKSKQKEDTMKGTDISEQSDAKMYVNMGSLTEDRGSQSSKTQADGNKTMADSKEFENQYTDLNNQLRDVGSAYDAISSI